ncbi:MAG: ROK family transcriptional regulator [Atopobiaceae bacterium]|nr:ROK family transcriptional regulator [Atopobiaceae bacterium]MCI1260184.1 ROK family transcriptional regulator [Atopobiaceae bacterium]
MPHASGTRPPSEAVTTMDQTTTAGRHQKTRNRVFRMFYDTDDSFTKQQVATELGLSLPTVHQSLTELYDDGLIYENGQEQSTGGRPATRLAMDGDARNAIGVLVTDHHFRLIATNLRRDEVATRTTRHEPASSIDALGDMLARELESFVDDEGIDRTRLLGVGVAIPGIIDRDADTLTHAPTLRLTDAPLEGLRSRIPYPTSFGNDANLGGFAEWYMRPNTKSIAYLSLESGVGGAVLLRGAPYVGDDGRSGEFGHICVETGGRTCSCGRRGCLEAYCSTRCLSDDLGLTLEEFFSALDKGDGRAQEVWDSYLSHLAIGVNDIHLALDCDVIIGGGVVRYLDPWLEAIRGRVAALDIFGSDASYVSLSHLYRHATQLGAALLCIDDFASNV